MANLNLGQDVAKKEKENMHNRSYCGQILFPTASRKNVSLRFSY